MITATVIKDLRRTCAYYLLFVTKVRYTLDYFDKTNPTKTNSSISGYIHSNEKQNQPPVVFCKKWCSEKFRRIQKQPFRGVLCNFIEITLWHGCSPVNLQHIFGTPFTKNTSGLLLLKIHRKTPVPKPFSFKFELLCNQQFP